MRKLLIAILVSFLFCLPAYAGHRHHRRHSSSTFHRPSVFHQSCRPTLRIAPRIAPRITPCHPRATLRKCPIIVKQHHHYVRPRCFSHRDYRRYDYRQPRRSYGFSFGFRYSR